MPIQGLTDRAARLPRLGTLRKGAPRPEQGNQPGKDLDYFRFDSEDELVEKAFLAAYGDEPRELGIYLPGPTMDDVWEAWREEWHHSGLVHRCDGRSVVVQRTEDKRGYRSWPLGDPQAPPCPYLGQEKPGCRETGRLSVLLPGLGRDGAVTVLTYSVHDIVSLTGSLRAYERLLRVPLYEVPFVLSRRMREISVPDAKLGRARRAKSLLFLEPHQAWMAARMLSYQRAHELGAGMDGVLPSAEMAALPAPEVVSGEDGEEWVGQEDEGAPPPEGGIEPEDDDELDVVPPRPVVVPHPKMVTGEQMKEMWRLMSDGLGWKVEYARTYIQSQYKVSRRADMTYEQGEHCLAELRKKMAAQG